MLSEVVFDVAFVYIDNLKIKKEGNFAMLKSLLNAGSGSINSLILDVFIIFAVVLAGSLIVYFLFEMVNAIVNKSGKPKDDDRLIFDEKEKKAFEDGIVSSFNLDEENTEEVAVEVEEEKPMPVFNENDILEVDEDRAEAEKAEMEAAKAREERENAERRAYLEARRQEILRRMQETSNEEAKEEESSAQETAETENVEEETVEEEELPAVEPIADAVAEEEVEQIQEPVQEEPNHLEEERKALEEEKQRYQTMVMELEQAKKALAEQTKEPEVKTVVVNKKLAGLSIEEQSKKLAKTEARLAATEKEYKQCRKEFIPLQRVWTTHERDEKKLRRKEALVAKQKVLLYGVNNYADIDEDKAKKLSEDLDLLDGLKLSVQHCEEVMKNNQERYPLLEKMYYVLKARNEDLKNDVESLTAEIARLEKEQEETNSENE